MGVGPILLGALLSLVGYGEMFLLVAGVTLAGAFLYHLVHGRADGARRRAVAAPAAKAPVPEAEPALAAH